MPAVLAQGWLYTAIPVLASTSGHSTRHGLAAEARMSVCVQSLVDGHVVKVLGQGAFGIVALVQPPGFSRAAAKLVKVTLRLANNSK